jgi:hypothetical protein
MASRSSQMLAIVRADLNEGVVWRRAWDWFAFM